MTSCELQQIAIERRLHGALGQAEAALLDAHLQSCQACRAYQAAARRTEDAMGQQVEAVLQGVDWEAVRGRVARHRRFWAVDLGTTLSGLAAAVLVTLALVPEPRRGEALLVMGLTSLLMGLATAQRALGRLRELRPGGEPFELLVEHRTRIRRDLVRWRRQLVTYAFLPFAVLTSIVLHWPDLSALPFLLGLSCVVGAMAAYDLLVRLPRVRRELADLEPGS
jgi:hypothetical protein